MGLVGLLWLDLGGKVRDRWEFFSRPWSQAWGQVRVKMFFPRTFYPTEGLVSFEAQGSVGFCRFSKKWARTHTLQAVQQKFTLRSV